MIDTRWSIEDERVDPEVAGMPRPLVTTWGVISRALRRDWRTWAGLSLTGILLATGALLLRPAGVEASATLLLAHKDESDLSAMATDVSLLETRAVASQVIGDLGLETSPEAFLSTVKADPVTNQILTITVQGPSKAAAEERAQVLVTRFLGFRKDQFQQLSNGLVSGYEQRVSELRKQLDEVTREYNALGGNSTAGQTKASDLLTQRTQLSSEINSLQRAVEDVSLTTNAAITSTHVIDAPHVLPHSRVKSVLLVLASGIVVGAAVGAGVVVLRALTSEFVRSRREVSRALGVPVRASVRRVGPAPGRLGHALWRARSGLSRITSGAPRFPLGRSGPRAARSRDLAVLVHALEEAVPRSRHSQRAEAGSQGPSALATPRHARPMPARLGLAAIDNPLAGAAVLAALAEHLAIAGDRVLLVDLSEAGVLHPPAVAAVTHFRPSGIPSLAVGPGSSTSGGIIDLQQKDLLRRMWDDADVVLALVEFDPGLDFGNVASWVACVVPLVTAGRSRADLLVTAAELAESAGLEVPFALMTGSDAVDNSAGLPPQDEEDSVTVDDAAGRRR